jgi:ABC-type multidrug transport system fused ATPase/permease subunit
VKLIDSILVKEIRRASGGLILISLFMLAMVAFDVIAPWPFKILIDNVLSPNPLTGAFLPRFLSPILHSRYLLGFLAVLIYFSSTFLLSITQYARDMFSKKVIKSVTANFSKKAFQNLEGLAIGFYRDQEIGDYIYRLSYDVSALGEFLEDGILPFVTSGLYLVITVGIMLAIDAKLTLLALCALPFLTIGLAAFNASLARATRRSEFFNSAAFSFIEEALTHLKIIQAFSEEGRESRRFDAKMERSLSGDLSLYELDFMLTLMVGLVIAVSYSLIILFGIRGVFSGTMTTGLLIVFIFYLDNLTVPMQDLIYAVTSLKQSYVKITRMRDFFSKRTHLQSTGDLMALEDTGVVFDKVSFKGKEGRGIVEHISFDIPRGKRTVIFGENGSGKTTVVNLLLRFIDKPSSGKILVGGMNLDAYDVDALRAAIAFVPQEVTLFNDTIFHNIQFGNPKSSWKDIKDAARLAAASEFIEKLPGHYHFKVGEGGNFLSGGQRQRIMLARALLKKDAKILLFDETLSALDVKTRLEVLSNLYEFSAGRTAILVSNIFDVARAADHVVVLDAGRVIYNGPASRLPQETSLYKLILKSEKALSE